MRAEVDVEALPIYSDVGMFTRGRPGFRPDPDRINWRGAVEGILVWIVAPPALWALLIFGLVAAVGWIRALLPTVH